MKRIFSLAVLIIFLAGCIPTSPLTPTPTPTTAPPSFAGKPNIIFILVDDLDFSGYAFMPKLKSLVTDQGITFTNYLVSESLCCPSRATTLRGQYAHNTQITNNELPLGGYEKFFNLGEENSTVAVWLQAAGYRTMLAGKYMNYFPLGSDLMHLPTGWNEWYSPMDGLPYSEYKYTLNENGKLADYGSAPADYGTDVYFGKTVDFIQRSAKEKKPFFVYLAPYAPHIPATPAPRHASLFPDIKAPRTPNFNEADVNDKPYYIRIRKPLTQTDQDEIDTLYRLRAQSLQAVDEGVEAIVNALKASGQLKNTYIFFTSDNGFHLGNHRQKPGKISPYQEEMRVEMVVRGPGVPSGVTLDHLTGNVDLAPTWADLAGAQAPDFCDGRSLVPLLGLKPPRLDQWRQAFPYEYKDFQVDQTSVIATPASVINPGLVEPPESGGTGNSASTNKKPSLTRIPPFRGMRLQNLSYVEYETGELELYDLTNDPYELQNLAVTADPQLLVQLSTRLKELADCVAVSCRTAEDAPFDMPASITQKSLKGSGFYGVYIDNYDIKKDSGLLKTMKELGAGWARIDVYLGDETSSDYTRFLEAGINVILTVINRDPSNLVVTNGSPEKWLNAGFPYQSKEKYQQEISSLLQPSREYLAQGRQVWVQAENEVMDVTLDPNAAFWDGTVDQYLVQIQALYEAVKAVSPNIPVVLTGFTSNDLDLLISPYTQNHEQVVNFFTKLLGQGKYEAVDLHFFGCAEEITAKVLAIKSLIPAGKNIHWISTENGGPDPTCKTTPMSWKKDLVQFEQEEASQVSMRLTACAVNNGSICLWYSLFDVKDRSDVFNHLGLLDRVNNTPRQKPAFGAFVAFIAQQK